MNYIILDMEWDNAYFYKEKRFINQIIQIGAVKLNENFDIVDTFEVVVKSDISKKVSGRFSKLTGITTDMMRSGVPLSQAVEMYNEWSGKDTVTMTWSNSDLYSIADNEKALLSGYRFYMEKYLDLQCFIQGELRLIGFEINSQISLQNAAVLLDITLDNLNLHTAKDDSLLCAAILKKCYNKKRFSAFIKDTRNPEFYKRLYFKSFYISDIKSEHIDKKYLKMRCDVCGKKAEKLTDWKFKNRWFVADFSCKHCDKRFSGRVSFRKTYDGVIVKKRVFDINPKVKEGTDNELQPVSAKV